MIRVGICGFGGLGHVHANTLAKMPDVEICAVCDKRPEQLQRSETQINIATEQGAFSVESCNTYTDFAEMLAAEQFDVMVLALPTDLHAEFAIRAMEAGCHVLSEKPMALTAEECSRMIAARDRCGKELLVAQCLRFWPEYVALKAAVTNQTYGKLQALYMERVGAAPGWSSEDWMRDASRSGGAILDLHLHDVDWLLHAIGVPDRVVGTGLEDSYGGILDLTVLWEYSGGHTVTVRSSWLYRAFRMAFQAVFTDAILQFGVQPHPQFHLLRPDSDEPEDVAVEPGNGYEIEVRYLLDCATGAAENTLCTAESTRLSVAMVELEARAIRERRAFVGDEVAAALR